ncbi:glycosyltransferase [Bordetella genomosp. 12]|uniref:glycosyltransferase n=1 Tax=Bordetella genomosp. 12 TaxID=463035 RepID=UPI001FC99EA9|nr:glycosyltransferase [Bordetella genomosp. 12]
MLPSSTVGALASGSSPICILLLAPGQSIHTIRWANGLAQRGLNVHLAALEAFPPGAYDPRVRLHRLPWGRPLGYALAAGALRRLVQRIQPDLTNVHYATGYGLLARHAGCRPMVLSAWGSDIYEFPRASTWHRRLLQRNLNAATALCATSQAMSREMSKLTRGAINITPFGIDESAFSPASHRNPDGPIVIGTVKALEHHYGIDVLLRTYARTRSLLSTTHPALAARLQLHIYGDGSLRAELQALAATLEITGSTRFMGKIPHDSVPEVLRGFEVYAALSRMDSFGVAILEASSCGLPVLVSDADGPAEIVVDGQTGFVVPREDDLAASRRLTELLLDPARRQALGQAGRQRVLERYTWNLSLDAMLGVYHRALSKIR